jgi:carboxymethylenebutenolidase
MTQDGVMAGTIQLRGHEGDQIQAWLAEPADSPTGGQVGGVVVLHHMPGYDEATKRITESFAANGYLAVMPNLHWREAGTGADPGDASAASRAAGGVPDERLVGDVDGAAAYLRAHQRSNGKVGVIGFCSGGRQAFLAACSLDLDAAVDCYGAFVVSAPPAGMGLKAQPLIGLVGRLSCPLLGLFGAEDSRPSPAETAQLARELAVRGKVYEFHTYEGAGHAFFATDRPSYRPEAAAAGWERVLDFFGRYLAA